ncbi:hypothetical protein N8873_03215 [Flavobacteriaceae bacterium]|nr:hypothetical protein [Flavobacteriaceae bacterium]
MTIMKMGKESNFNGSVILGLIVLALLSRLIPHPPNFAPITSIALFAGFHSSKKIWALQLPIGCMFITDLFLGLHSLIPIVYASFFLISYIGIRAKSLSLGTVLLASTSFFVFSNLGVWYYYYPLTWEGFMSCFVLALPFYANALAGDLFYTSVLNFSFSKIKGLRFSNI